MSLRGICQPEAGLPLAEKTTRQSPKNPTPSGQERIGSMDTGGLFGNMGTRKLFASGICIHTYRSSEGLKIWNNSILRRRGQAARTDVVDVEECIRILLGSFHQDHKIIITRKVGGPAALIAGYGLIGVTIGRP
jgi:hypothetical protein